VKGNERLQFAAPRAAFVGQQKRLELALAFVDDPLPRTREVASVPGMELLQPGVIEAAAAAAAAEIAEAIDQSFTS
jgi:hypothetical protein